MWLSPLSLLVAATLALLVAGARLKAGARRWLQCMVVVGLLLSTPLAANLQVAWLEQAVPDPSSLCAGAPAQDIVLLTAGFWRTPVNAQDHAALSQDSLLRLMAAVQAQRQHAASRLLILGGGEDAIAESTVAASLASALGVPADKIVVETRSHTTWENAREARLMQPALSQPITLVTSAVHMRRAASAFNAQGVAVCPLVSDRRFVRPRGMGVLWPQASAIRKTETVWHEWLGSWGYAWRGSGDNRRGAEEPDH
jgi:uncharacterized SAM-binding protein YcdF (DUF218 family)